MTVYTKHGKPVQTVASRIPLDLYEKMREYAKSKPYPVAINTVIVHAVALFVGLEAEAKAEGRL
jgi:hypothetical protein